MKTHTLLKGLLVTALLTPLYPLGDAGSLMAQDRLWANGPQLLDFNAPQSSVQTCSLPSGHDYTGAPALYSQNVQYDENGKLLFFVIDGRIYDQAGYLIADNDRARIARIA